MGESVRYIAIDLAAMDRLLRGTTVDPALTLAHEELKLEDPIVVALTRLVQEGYPLYLDDRPMRGARWVAYAELASWFTSAWRAMGRPLGQDAWAEGQRMQWLVADWHPLPKDFGQLLTCRPNDQVRFRHAPPPRSADWQDYLDVWPHGHLRRDEVREHLPSVFRLLMSLCDLLGGEDHPLRRSPYAPGQNLDRQDHMEILSFVDDSFEGWQLARVVALYRALCRVRSMPRDLVALGY